MDVATMTHRIRVTEWALLLPHLRALLPPRPRILEIGCGDGTQSRFLAELGSVVATDPFATVFPSHSGTAFVRTAAERLGLRTHAFDLVYSSSVLEHIGDVDGALAELRRVVKPNGVHVHVVPTTIWKSLSIVTHYGVLARSAFRRLRGKRPAAGSVARADTSAWRAPVARSWRQRLVPEVHGTARSNLAELHEMRVSSWSRLFERCGYKIGACVPLLLYSPPELTLFPPNRPIARLGLSSCRAFILRSAR